jgi:hypothetical protein
VSKVALPNAALCIQIPYPPGFELVYLDIQSQDKTKKHTEFVCASLKSRRDALLSDAFNHCVNYDNLRTKQGFWML